MLDVFAQYGWAGFIILFLVDKIWPYVSRRFSTERDATIKRDKDDREWQRKMDERQIVALESIAAVLPEFNTRLEIVEKDTRYLRDGMGVLLERKATVVTTTIPSP
jgi:hypothetical protein